LINLLHLFLIAPAILMALTVHEFAHGWVANRYGDPTPRLAGRLTFNPIKHLDPIGTIMLFIFRFGWAKPVPVNPYNLKNPKSDMVRVALAGPLSNLACGVLGSLILRGMIGLGVLGISGLRPGYLIVAYFVLYNLILCAFNLLPIFPLDGSQVLLRILPRDAAYQYAKTERYGIFILMGLIFLGSFTGVDILWSWIGPFTAGVSKIFAGYSIFELFTL
jgi:Zn-dependent protease